jgi:hypothetical protein
MQVRPGPQMLLQRSCTPALAASSLHMRSRQRRRLCHPRRKAAGADLCGPAMMHFQATHIMAGVQRSMTPPVVRNLSEQGLVGPLLEVTSTLQHPMA